MLFLCMVMVRPFQSLASHSHGVYRMVQVSCDGKTNADCLSRQQSYLHRCPVMYDFVLHLHPWSSDVRLSLGRDADLMDINVEFTVTVIKAASVLYLLPEFLKPYVQS